VAVEEEEEEEEEGPSNHIFLSLEQSSLFVYQRQLSANSSNLYQGSIDLLRKVNMPWLIDIHK
jgi:hypothetical protein